MSDEILSMGYDAVLATLKQQDQTLANVRNRSTALLSAATVATSVAAAVGLLVTDPAKGSVLARPAAIVILVLVILIGASSLYTLWPIKRWVYGPSPLSYVRAAERRATEDAFRTRTIRLLVAGAIRNRDQLRRRMLALQAAIVLLIAELVTVVVSLMLIRS